MPDPKSAEELALAAFRWERDAARDWQRYARTAARRAKHAEVFSIRILRLHKADKWHQVASIHRRNVSTLARIIRAIRAEKEETDTNPQKRDEMTNREKIIRINEIAVRCINAGPISLESGIENIRKIVNGVTLDEPREVPAEVEFDAEEIVRIVVAAVDRTIKEHFKPTPLKPREETLRELQAAIHDLAREKGWWDGYDRDDLGRLKLTTDQVISKIALIHAELSEAVEEARKSPNYSEIYYDSSKPEGFAVELADALIRTLDLFGALGIDAAEFVRIKHEFNKTRPVRHGGKLA